ncbi:MAG: ComF family protein [Oscillospiraceae bacterium]|nr:ComF family protein [Oscillospiraceae bacterium]
MVKPLNLVYPPKCVFCKQIMGHGANHEMPCEVCVRTLPIIPRGKIAVQMPGMLCVAPLAYRGRVPAALKGLKFHGRLSGVRCFAALMRSALTAAGRTEFELVTWAPLGFWRLHGRGYNQSRLLARELAKMLGLPCRATLLKTRGTPPQSRLADSGARLLNASGAYRPRPFADLSGKRVLLVDDIITSGATALSCARELRDAGAADVTCVTAARSRI